MRPFQLLVFDWDGTLSDSSATIVSALRQACSDLGLPVPDKASALSIIGLGLREGLFSIIPHLDEPQFEALSNRYRQCYFSKGGEVGLYEGVEEGLERLLQAGFLMAVATGKSRRGLDQALSGLKLARFFVTTRCADETFSKPNPAMLLEVMDICGMDAKETLMIGDTTYDLQMAANASVAAVAMTYGAHPLEDLLPLSPIQHFDHFGDLVEWTISLKGR